MNRIYPSILLVGALTVLAGCSSTQSTASAHQELPLASPVATHAGSDLDVVVQSVVIPTSRKSWSNGAAWDEYTLVLTNRSATQVVIESAALVDVRAAELAPGDQPVALEKLSKKRWTRYLREGVPVDPYGADPAAARAEANRKNVPFQIVAWTVACAIPPAALVGAAVVGSAAFASQRSTINQEFHQRRLKLPLSLVAGQEVTGSFFFPVTPGPQRLLLGYRRDGTLCREQIDLPALARLHLPPGEPAAMLASAPVPAAAPAPAP